MTLFVCAVLVTAGLVSILAITRLKALRERKRIKTWRFGRVE